jgi:hypothetical protein
MFLVNDDATFVQKKGAVPPSGGAAPKLLREERTHNLVIGMAICRITRSDL